jgi:glycosyltransferase involved in cell wall biosynthesis
LSARRNARVKQRRIAFIHDWLTVYSGAERVLEQMFDCFPESDLFSLIDFVPDKDRGFLRGKKPFVSFLQKLPFMKRFYRHALPLMPLAIEQHDLSSYDIIISSSHAVAKGVLVGPDQLHICMCYSPIRYAWDLQHQYLRESNLTRGPLSWMARILLHFMRVWDARTANGVDHFIAISGFIARRIKRVYGRASTVIYPPVDVSAFTIGQNSRQPGADRKGEDTFYLTASRMVPYKKMDLIAEAFAKMPSRKLVIIGDGPQMESVKAKSGPNVQVLGFQSHAVLRDHLQRARAFVFAAEEDFGIAPLEAQACGTPVIAFGKGGALETILDGKTGLLFEEQTVESIVHAVEKFEQNSYSADACRANAMRFAPDRFRREFTDFVELKWREFRNERALPTSRATEPEVSL